MCGIWGLLSLDKIKYNLNDLFIKFNSIKNRGPDRSTFIVNDNYIIGFHRLAIMDTSVQGDQPFSISFKENNKLRTVHLTCNGEIYNFKELKESIEVKEYCEKINYNYRSNSDCEVLLILYLMQSEDIKNNLDGMLNKLNGEFAFSIFDITENLEDKMDKDYKLWLARDRFGIRPLFYSKLDDNTIVYGSEMKSLVGINNNKVEVFDPRSSQIWFSNRENENIKLENASKLYYAVGNLPMVINPELSDVYRMIRDTLISSVKVRLQSDREIGCLLSGGLDSSLISAIASDILKKEGRQLRTFSIGMPDSPDVHYAKIVAKHIDSIHTNIEIPDEVWVDSIEKIIEVTETFDITTIRASTGQYLISKWISENTDIKVLLIGDGSDEATGGYLYFHKAPNDKELHFECKRLLHYIHYFDVLRADRGVASNGLEARVPFLDYNFIDLYMHIDSRLRIPSKHNDVVYEKYLLRKAFANTNYLPDCVLWRRKEAFSDGISSKNKSWYEIIQEKVNLNMSNEYYEENKKKYKNFLVPHTKEALYYHEIYDKYYPKQYDICPYYWLPKWVDNINDPSARTLKIYTEFDKEDNNKLDKVLKVKNE